MQKYHDKYHIGSDVNLNEKIDLADGIFECADLDSRECRMCKKEVVQTTSVCDLLDFYERRTSFVLVMRSDVNDVMDLLDYLNFRQEPLSEPSARFIFKQILDSLKLCHNAGIYHRDLKDENIIINPSTYLVKLIDFGCATSIKSSPYKDVAGTPMFSAPEWWRVYMAQKKLQKNRLKKNKKPLEKPEIEKLSSYRWRGDTCESWSLGIMLYTMLHIKLPFDSCKEICERDIRTVIKDDTSILAYDLMTKLLEKNPRRRLSFEKILEHPWLLEGDDSVYIQRINEEKIRNGKN